MTKKGFSKNIFSFIAVVALLIFFHFSGILSPVENLLARILNPWFDISYFSGSSLRGGENDKKDKQELLSILNELQEENNRLIAENASLKVIEEENKKLREYLDFLSEKGYSFVLANVVSKKGLDAFSSGQGVIIDKGANDGIRHGLVVVDSQGIVVGKVVAVNDFVSEVCLAVNGDCKFAVSSQNKDTTLGVSQGDLGITIKMDFIPQTEEINKNDVIVTSGLETDVPRGLVLGKVANIDKESNKVWQSATLDPIASFSNLNIVSVLLPKQ